MYHSLDEIDLASCQGRQGAAHASPVGAGFEAGTSEAGASDQVGAERAMHDAAARTWALWESEGHVQMSALPLASSP